MSEFEAYITTSTGAESDYSCWPADPDQPVVEPPEEEVDPPVDGITSAGIVSGGITDSAGEDVISF